MVPEPGSESPVPGKPLLRPPGSERHDGAVRKRRPSRLLWLLFAVMVVLVLVVVLVLPEMAQRTPASESRSAVTTRLPSPAALDAPSVARHDAEQALRDYLRQRAHPALENAAQWGAPEWQQSLDLASTGDRALGSGQYLDAGNAYREATALLDTLQRDKDLRFDQILQDAGQLLDQDASQALALFEIAQAMRPGAEAVARGLERARLRPRVEELLHQAQLASRDGQLAAALESLRAALELDSAYQPARRLYDDLRQRRDSERFNRSMSEALAALEQGRLTDARAALQEAARLAPGHIAVEDAQARLEDAVRQQSLSVIKQRAGRQEAAEQWSAAADSYRQALAIDPQTGFARAGLARAQDRQELHRQLDHYLADSQRLYSPEPLANARQLLDELATAVTGEQQLQAKLAELAARVRQATIPLPVQVTSDGHTEVAIFHVGRFGRFLTRQLELRPGNYVAVGKRAGYRDVRREFSVFPDQPPVSIDIRCQEAV